MTDVPDELSGSTGKHLLPAESLKLEQKPCFRADTPVEEFVYCRIPSNWNNGIDKKSLIISLKDSKQAERFSFDCEDVRNAIDKLIDEGWITRLIGEGMLYRTNFERSICLQWL